MPKVAALTGTGEEGGPGLKGFPEAITSVFPKTAVQTCIVHLIRYSMQFVSWKERKLIGAALRPI